MVGKGNTAEVLDYGTKRVCKLFFEGYPREYVELEYKNAKEAFNLNIKVPEPFEIITVGKRNGIVYEKIDGKTLLYLMQEKKKDSNRMLDEFAKLHREILSNHSTNALPYKEFLFAMIKGKMTENQMLIDEISALPDGECLLHGDFHPNNILIKSDATPVIIDFMNVCHGPAEYDIARTFFLLKESNELIAKSYLNKMGVSEKDIFKYIHVIEFCRKFEN